MSEIKDSISTFLHDSTDDAIAKYYQKIKNQIALHASSDAALSEYLAYGIQMVIEQSFCSMCFSECSSEQGQLSDLGQKIAGQISSYATKNAYEFVAEVFVKILNGTSREIDPDIMQLYIKMGGLIPLTGENLS
jgi:hypothetical protein